MKLSQARLFRDEFGYFALPESNKVTSVEGFSIAKLGFRVKPMFTHAKDKNGNTTNCDANLWTRVSPAVYSSLSPKLKIYLFVIGCAPKNY